MTPLAGIRVADLSRVLAGPLCTMVLADLGADVIKVEHPSGDETRGWGPPFAGEDAAYYLSLNRSKRSVVLDLSTPEGLGRARRLCLASDVVVENFRPGTLDRLGLPLAGLREEQGGLVTCSITAFGPDGDPRRAGYDLAMQALTGLMSVTGEADGSPAKVGVALLDVIAGLYAATGIVAALRERDATGRGRHVDVSLFDAGAAAMVNQAANHLIGGLVPGRRGSAHPNIVPYQAFRASDGHLVIAAGNDDLFRRLCDVLELPEAAARFATNAERVRARDELVPILAETLARRPVAVWVERLQAAGVPAEPVRSIEEAFASAEGRAVVQDIADPVRGTLRLVASPIRLDGDRGRLPSPPPLLGEHTEPILDELDGR